MDIKTNADPDVERFFHNRKLGILRTGLKVKHRVTIGLRQNFPINTKAYLASVLSKQPFRTKSLH